MRALLLSAATFVVDTFLLIDFNVLTVLVFEWLEGADVDDVDDNMCCHKLLKKLL